jgi:DNA uptake protein ComE-like DNA-binding protein
MQGRFLPMLVVLASARTLLDLRAGLPPDWSVPTAALPTVVPDLAQAGWRELSWLPGIGAGRARSIVAHRSRLGVTPTPQNVQLLPGVGESTANRIAEWYAQVEYRDVWSGAASFDRDR